MRKLWIVLLFIVGSVVPSGADVACDGVDDNLSSGLTISHFLTADTGTLMLWHKPTGLPENNGGGSCFEGGSCWPRMKPVRGSG